MNEFEVTRTKDKAGRAEDRGPRTKPRGMAPRLLSGVVLALMTALRLLATAPADVVTRVVKVNDGDTFLTSDRDRVRMLGVDAAETYQPGGDVATEALEKYIAGREVRLEPDSGGSDTDHFGRLLRWVWVGDTNVNLLMVARGYAPVRLYQENLKYQDTLEAAELEAARVGRGLWSFNVYTPPSIDIVRDRLAKRSPGSPGVISWAAADQHIGELAVVQGTIVRTYQSDQVLFLNFDEDFRNTFAVAVFTADLDRFPENAGDFYKGRTVKVSGIIKQYRGAPEMIVRNPEQIEIQEPEPEK